MQVGESVVNAIVEYLSLYLDYNASAPILPEVLDTMIKAYKNTPGNADSRTHIYGTNAQKLVNESRASIASVLGVDPSEIIFTSGSTESNNTVILEFPQFFNVLKGDSGIIGTTKKNLDFTGVSLA